jgi:hypothetical protein
MLVAPQSHSFDSIIFFTPFSLETPSNYGYYEVTPNEEEEEERTQVTLRTILIHFAVKRAKESVVVEQFNTFSKRVEKHPKNGSIIAC